jgi:DNA gyrase subunit A
MSDEQLFDLSAKNVLPIEIEDEMRSSYLDYAMSVIVGRALPDVRDGLKPVHRRILYAMHDLGMQANKPHKKSARIVGEVLGKYHPHGDTAVYDAMVRMAQSFSQRYVLVDGHGNFGSVDGDSAAAMRYTEARLSKLTGELLRDIDKDTVNWVPNFDESLEEPAVLPARYPNLLVNGSSGIAVGMATNIPPHNLGEIIDATIAVIDNPELTAAELNKIVKGPDFPTGGIIMGRDGITKAYETGRGIIRVRGVAEIQEGKNNKQRIVVTELPYQVNKARLSEAIAELVRDKKITEISDLRDESDRKGMHLVIELKRDVIPQVVLNKLFKHTQLEETFGIIMLALVDGVPKVLSLPVMLSHYINHQVDIITRRTKFELDKAEKRAHILEGLLIALDNLDAVIKLIRGSKTVEEAHNGLMAQFKLSTEQAQAILDMRLAKLTGLERQKVIDEYNELKKLIEYLKSVLADSKLILGIIKDELKEVRDKYSDERRTQITSAASDMDIEDFIAEEDMVVSVSHTGYVKRQPVTVYKSQGRGGKGVIGMDLKDEDFVEHLFVASTHHHVLFFTTYGKVYRLKVHELPLAGRTAKGQNIVNLLPLSSEEKIAAVISIKDFAPGRFMIMATKNGIVKKTPIEDYETARRGGIIALKLRDADELMSVKMTNGDADVMLVSRNGAAIRFPEADVRSMGRSAGGVIGMKMREGDHVLSMGIAMPDTFLFIITEKGRGKRTPINQFTPHHRGGKGMIALRLTPKDFVAGAMIVEQTQEVMIISAQGTMIRTPAKSISKQGRDSRGVSVMKLSKEDAVSAVARIMTDKEEDEAPEAEQLKTGK